MKTSTKRTLCRTMGFLALLAMIFFVGGTEMGWMPMTAMWWAFVLELIGAALLWKGGVIRVR